MTLQEALKTQKIRYSGTRDNYKINDDNPYILIIDPKYKEDSILAINLHYLDEDSLKRLLTKIQKFDDKIVGVGLVKAFLTKHSGIYNLKKEKKIERYKKLIKEFPELRKAIRRYKLLGIEK